MPRLSPDSNAAPLHARLARLLVQALLTGLLIMLVFPAARGYSQLLGWIPFWLVVMPAVALLLVQRHHLAAWWCVVWPGLPVAGSRRPRRMGRPQARRA